MSEPQEHNGNTEVKGLFKGAMFQENYRKDKATYFSIVESKFQDRHSGHWKRSTPQENSLD